MSIIANRYVQALLDLPKSEEENKILEEGLNEMSTLFNTNNEFKKTLLDPRLDNNLKIEIIKDIFQKYSNEVFINFVSLLIKEKRLNYIQEISDEYTQINQKLKKELNIKIIVANTIEQEQIDAIVQKFKNIYKVETINYEVHKDETLLGGVKVMVGNKVYDGSVATQLKQMF